MDITSTDEYVAKLILEQSYRDRMDMAKWLAEVISDKLDGEPSDYRLTDADFAEIIGSWADSVFDASDAN